MAASRRFRKLTIPLSCLCLLLLASVRSWAIALPLVYVVKSYDDSYSWQASYMAGLVEAIGDSCRLASFSMNTKNLPPERHADMADQAWRKFQQLSPAMVILADDAALKYLGPRLANTAVPFVFLGINNNPRNYFTTLPKNMTGVLERPLILRSLDFMRHILPESRKALVLSTPTLPPRW